MNIFMTYNVLVLGGVSNVSVIYEISIVAKLFLNEIF